MRDRLHSCLMLLVAFIAMATVNILPGQFVVEAGSDCKKPVLVHGKSTWKEDKTAIKYKCYDPYELYGTEWDDCIDASWQLPLPACVAPGCADVNITDPLVTIFVLMSASVIEFECPPETWLNGSYHIWCNETHWSDVPPTCVKMECPEISPNSVVVTGAKSAVVEGDETPSNMTEEILGSTPQPTNETEEHVGATTDSTNGTAGSVASTPQPTNWTQEDWVSGNSSANQTHADKGAGVGGCPSSGLVIAMYATLATLGALIPVVALTVKVTVWVYHPASGRADAKSLDETRPIAVSTDQPPNYTK